MLNKPQKSLLVISALLVAVPIALPLAAVAVLALLPAENIWPHLWATVLPNYIWQTVVLLLGVGLVTFIVGVAMAWAVTVFEFPGAKLLRWMALLPLAMPSYIVSFTYVEFLNYAGPLQSALRKVMGWKTPTEYHFPEIRSMGGAILVLGLVLYPYVYVSARAAFLKQSQSQLDVARTLGKSSWQVFASIVMPQARPAIIVGLTLVLMECLNDIAAVGFFGVQTLALGIYSTWLGQGNLGGGAQLSFVMLVAVASLNWIERRSRGRERLMEVAAKPKPLEKIILQGAQRYAVPTLLFIPIVLGFFLPAWLLLRHVLRRLDALASSAFLNALLHSLMMALIACVLTLLAGLLLAYANRLLKTKSIRFISVAATLGYAVPGTVLGIGLLVPLGQFDNWLATFMRAQFGVATGLLLSGSLFALSLAYMARFLMMGFGALDNGLQKIASNVDDVARTLGRTRWRILAELHLPLLQPSLAAGALLVFVEAMKELPATLILRPFDFDTLATSVFTLSSLDKLEDSAVPALAIVAVGLVPVILLSKNLREHAARD